jgi:Ca2+-binding EF-hand superfamily protein
MSTLLVLRQDEVLPPLFRALDADGDGRITVGDVQNVLRCTEARAVEVIADAGVDTLYVDMAEFVRVMCAEERHPF